MPPAPEPEPGPVPGLVETGDYSDFSEAVAAVPDGGTLRLSTDTVGTIAIDDGRSINVDLAGLTLSADGAEALNVSDGEVLLKNGTVNGTGAVAIRIDTRKSQASAMVTIDPDVVVTDPTNPCILIAGKGATLNTSGQIIGTSTVYPVISGNGAVQSSGVIVNVMGGKVLRDVREDGGHAIYFPSGGQLNVSDGYIAGAEGIYLKSGELVVTGGTIEAFGPKGEYEHNGNGANSTGDALAVENCKYPGGVPKAYVQGGTFISKNGAAVASYAIEGLEPITGFITGGTFSSDVSALCAEGYSAVQDGDSWVVQ